LPGNLADFCTVIDTDAGGGFNVATVPVTGVVFNAYTTTLPPGTEVYLDNINMRYNEITVDDMLIQSLMLLQKSPDSTFIYPVGCTEDITQNCVTGANMLTVNRSIASLNDIYFGITNQTFVNNIQRPKYVYFPISQIQSQIGSYLLPDVAYASSR
jgi:hypothetical protein